MSRGRCGLGAALLLLSTSCLLPGRTRVVTAVELRAQVVGVALAALPPTNRAALERGQVWVGASEADVFIARGAPKLWWRTQVDDTACAVIVSADPHTPSEAREAITLCGGLVAQVAPIEPALPCWRLAEVGPRVAAEATYFEALPLRRQWQIVAGMLERGQAERDVRIAFGEPYATGFDEREDGQRADQLTFLDRSGDAYGLNVTLVRDRVVGWQMPVRRELTAEAEQRRLDAIEQRLTAKLADLEAIAIQQHRETVALFGQVMDNQDRMLAELERPVDVQAVAPAPAPPGPPDGGGGGAIDGGGGSGGGGVTIEHTSQPPDDRVSRNASAREACFATCKRDWEARVKRCAAEAACDQTCGRDERCQTACAMQQAECGHSKHYMACTATCPELTD